MNLEKIKIEWADLMVQHFKLSEQIDKETDQEERASLEVDLNIIENEIAKCEAILFKKTEVDKCMNCIHSIKSIHDEPCQSCIAGDNHFTERTE